MKNAPPESFLSDILKIDDESTPIDIILRLELRVSSEKQVVLEQQKNRGTLEERGRANNVEALFLQSKNYSGELNKYLRADYTEMLRRERKNGSDESVLKKELIEKATIGSVSDLFIPEWYSQT